MYKRESERTAVTSSSSSPLILRSPSEDEECSKRSCLARSVERTCSIRSMIAGDEDEDEGSGGVEEDEEEGL